MNDEKMTTDQKPWRAEMPKTYDKPPPWTEGCCDSESVWHLVVDANANADRLLAELDAARAERDESRALLLQSEQERNETRLALIDAGIPATAPAPPGYAGCIVFGVGERIRSLADERDAARARIAELEADEAANLRAIGEASGAMYEPDMGPTWPGSWEDQVSMIRGLRESQRYETNRFLRIEKLLGDHKCYCDCDCSSEEEHGEHCGERCLPCKVNAALRGASL